MERSIIGVKQTDRIRNTTLRSITQVADVGVKIAKLKWECMGGTRSMNAPGEVGKNRYLLGARGSALPSDRHTTARQVV